MAVYSPATTVTIKFSHYDENYNAIKTYVDWDINLKSLSHDLKYKEERPCKFYADEIDGLELPYGGISTIKVNGSIVKKDILINEIKHSETIVEDIEDNSCCDIQIRHWLWFKNNAVFSQAEIRATEELTINVINQTGHSIKFTDIKQKKVEKNLNIFKDFDDMEVEAHGSTSIISKHFVGIGGEVMFKYSLNKL